MIRTLLWLPTTSPGLKLIFVLLLSASPGEQFLPEQQHSSNMLTSNHFNQRLSEGPLVAVKAQGAVPNVPSLCLTVHPAAVTLLARLSSACALPASCPQPGYPGGFA